MEFDKPTFSFLCEFCFVENESCTWGIQFDNTVRNWFIWDPFGNTSYKQIVMQVFFVVSPSRVPAYRVAINNAMDASDTCSKLNDSIDTLSLLLKPGHEWVHSGPKLPNSSLHLSLQMSATQLAKRALVVCWLSPARESERENQHHTLLLGKSLGTRRRKIHSAVTIVPRLFTFSFLVPLTPVES